MNSSVLLSKVLPGVVSTVLYGGGTGGIIGGTLGLGNNQAEILNEERGDSYTLQIRKPAHIKRTPSVIDSEFYKKYLNTTPEYVAAEGSKLPEGFVNRHIYQMKSSDEFEENHQSFYCTKEHFDNLIIGTDKTKRGDLKRGITPTDKGDRGQYKKCVNVIGHKEYFGDTKGRGSGKLIYTIEYNDFATMLLSVVTADNGKIEVDGANYKLGKKVMKSGPDKGEIVGGKRSEKREVTPETKNKLIILPSDAFENKTDEGGFDFDPANVCQKDECFSDPTKTEYSDRVGKAEKGFQAKDGKVYKAKEGSINYDSGVAPDGLFPNYNCRFSKDPGDYFKEVGKVIDSRS